ncbi:hypothetical protein P9112_002328 [Eukaryota sp. TZLM1-RC]
MSSILQSLLFDEKVPVTLKSFQARLNQSSQHCRSMFFQFAESHHQSLYFYYANLVSTDQGYSLRFSHTPLSKSHCSSLIDSSLYAIAPKVTDTQPLLSTILINDYLNTPTEALPFCSKDEVPMEVASGSPSLVTTEELSCEVKPSIPSTRSEEIVEVVEPKPKKTNFTRKTKLLRITDDDESDFDIDDDDPCKNDNSANHVQSQPSAPPFKKKREEVVDLTSNEKGRTTKTSKSGKITQKKSTQPSITAFFKKM